MNLKLWNIILISILFFACQNDRNLEGNYSICHNGERIEIKLPNDAVYPIVGNN
ncbi:hypothetical protein [Aquimarina macrocephali]|uniref:hypothetical protein n=1 Tax=Aquimarina macrocephali TaxID=666563 RepID=UPI0004B3047B|nr:hypothetical protein [Aquimarina macrocephali]